MKLKSKKIINLMEPISVYDLTIESHHNFGVYLNNTLIMAHNCEPLNAD